MGTVLHCCYFRHGKCQR